MVKFLDSDGIKSELSKVLKKSNDFIYLMSPYLRINDRYKAILKDMSDQGKEIHIIYGKKEMRADEAEWCHSIKRMGVHYWKDLHSKCYMNEKMAIITSLNLYEYSMINNHEMGVVIYRDQDSEVYDDILDEVKRLIRISETVKEPTPETEVLNKLILKKPISAHINGYCIRCGETIKYNTTKPYCEKDFKNWNRYKNPDYEEKHGYCHICRSPMKSSMNHPICQDCIKNNRIR
ncbi:phospholipase D-like domain-containing protein [Candidatus Methanoprimaticola sp. MG2]|uniref:phospholipase D-like domain-containing protein n=1 Tax=Candidatus Methanoprimaticola sp. MG2 TaxID=3228838 RepID=UPI0039C5E5F2